MSRHAVSLPLLRHSRTQSQLATSIKRPGHAVNLPLRRHSRTQSQLATSVKRHSVPRSWKSRDSRARRRRTFDVLNYG